MSKRSREASFSPSTGLNSASVSGSDNEFDLDETAHPGKIAALSEPLQRAGLTMQCSLPPHRHALGFPNIEAFEVHYAKDHSNRCSECSKNFPSAHFLTLHIDENHNPLREELQAQGEKTYGCFVEDCEKQCSTPQKRRLHLIDKHAFPKMYNFRVVDKGIDHSSSMLRETNTHRRRVSTTGSPADAAMRHRRSSSQQVNANGVKSSIQKRPSAVKDASHNGSKSPAAEDPDIGELEKSMSALQFVPPSVMRQQARKPPK
jgi:hypothetical protein